MEDNIVRIELITNYLYSINRRESKGNSQYGAVNEPKDSAEEIREKRGKTPKNRSKLKLKNKEKEMATELKVMAEIVQNMKEEMKAEKQCLQQMICMVEGLKEVKELSGTESRLLEGTTIIEDVTCNCCQLTEDLMDKLNVEMKSPVKLSDFRRLDEEYKKNNGSSVPSYLAYVVRGIKIDITANTTFSDDILVLPRALFYAVIDEMHNMQLQDINEDVILRWGFVINNAHKMDLDVEFAKKHLKKITHAYFTCKEPANDMEELHTLVPQILKSEATMDEMEEQFLRKSRKLNVKKCEICIDEADLFSHGEPLSKGILQPN